MGKLYKNSQYYVDNGRLIAAREVGVNFIEADDVNNPNSGRVMEKVGMYKEGVHRQAGRNNQGFSILFKHEYPYDLVLYASTVTL